MVTLCCRCNRGPSSCRCWPNNRLLLARQVIWRGICVSPWVLNSAQRRGHGATGVWSYYCRGRSLCLVILFVTMGLRRPVWLSFTVFPFDRSRTFPCPLPLLLLKPCSSPRNTTFFLDFPHSLIETGTHLPLIFPFISPLSSRYPLPSYTVVLLLKMHL